MSSDFSILSDNGDLPMGWVITELENVCTVQGGYAFKSKDYTEKGIPLVRISNLVENNNVDLDSNPIFLPENYLISHSNYCLRVGDILIAMSGATTGKMAVFRCSSDALLNQRVGRFIIKDKTLVDKPYLSKLIENLSSKVAQKAYGGAQPNISPSEIERLLIPLPPLNEQRRIVEKVEALMARSRKAKEALDAIPTLIEQFRQSVLAAAFRGDLTADWREQNPNIEPASILMESLQTGIFRKPPDEILGKLPEKWEWARFADVANIKSNLVDLSEYQNYPHIAPNHIRSGTGELLEYTTIAEDKVFSAKHLFKSGQILYSKIRPYLAKAVIVNFEGLCSADMYPIDSLINTSYLHRWMISSEFTELASGKQGRTVLPKINQNALNELCVPVPPLEEQAKIVEYVENALTYIHQLMETNFQVTTNLELLNQSILSKAFRGELVEQDPTDEPASVLLERIQKEREKEKAKVKQTGAKKLKK